MITFVGAGKIKPGMIGGAAVHAHHQSRGGHAQVRRLSGDQDPHVIVFFEQYADEAAQAAHFSSDEMKAFQAAFEPCIDMASVVMSSVEKAVSASD